jgi:predicted kinase
VTAPVFIVSGCSGVGKSTVSRLLTGALQPSVHMPIDVFLHLFEDPFPDAASPEGAHRYAVVGAAAAAAAAQLALGGYTVILDSPMFPAGADGVAEICGCRGVEVHYAVLRSDLDTCLARSKRRDPAGPADLEAFRSLHDHFIDLAHRDGHVIDASGPPKRVAAAVLSGFRSGQLSLSAADPSEPQRQKSRPS